MIKKKEEGRGEEVSNTFFCEGTALPFRGDAALEVGTLHVSLFSLASPKGCDVLSKCQITFGCVGLPMGTEMDTVRVWGGTVGCCGGDDE